MQKNVYRGTVSSVPIRRTLVYMKLSLLFLVIALQVSATNMAQDRISLQANNLTVAEVLEKIEKTTSYRFSYSNDVLPLKMFVSVNVVNASINEVMLKLFEGYPLQWKIYKKNNVVISPISPDAMAKLKEADIISGTVFNNKGEPIVGASITIKGSNIGTTTDANGKFSINANIGDILVITSLGYIAQEVSITHNTPLTVTLIPIVNEMDEVVVVGYGFQRKTHLTGAISVITEKDLKNRPVATAAGVLQGADPAVNITLNSGSLDAGYRINIRGVASVNGGTPLIIADGIEVNLNQINPNDIESVTVLKDASAAAVYGAKASSGVILITTKKGKNLKGKARINLNSRYGISQNTTSTDFIRTGYDHVNIVNTFYEIYQGTPMALYSGDDLQALLDRRNDLTEHPDRPWTIVKSDGRYYYYGNFDWYNYFYNKRRGQNEHNLSVIGGNENTNYYVSGRFWDQQGIFKIYKDNLKTYSFRTKIESKLKSWLKLTSMANYNSGIYKYAGYKDEQFTINALQSNVLSSFVPRNPDGTIMQYPNQLNANSPIGAGHGGVLTANANRNSRSDKYIVLSNQIDANITKDLVLTTIYAYKQRNRLYRYRNIPFQYSRSKDVLLTFTSGTIYNAYEENHFNANNHNLNIYATYNKKWGKGHNFTYLTGGQYEDYRQTNLRVEKKDLLSDDLNSFSIANGEAVITQSIAAFKTLGFFGRLNYDYQGKYMFEASGRMDGTSRFAPKDRWGFFPAASVGWRMSEESFWEPLKGTWSNSKLRLSMGSLGNQQVDYYSYIEQISTSNTMSYTFDGNTTANYASVSNPISSSLTWETVTTYDIGLDLGFFNNRLNIMADYYIRNTKDMLTPSLTLPAVYGANTPRANAADLRTKGWELYVSYNNKINVYNSPLYYTVAATLGDYQTTITRYNNPDKLISDYYVGMKLGEIWGYRVKGLFASDADAAAYQAKIDDKLVNNRVYNSKKDNYLRAGDIEFIDIDGNGIINEGAGMVGNSGDKVIIGNSLPRYSYSFRLNLNWKGLDLSAFLQGVGKQDWFPDDLAYDFWGPYSFPSLSFIHKDFLTNTWSEENPNSYFPRPRGYATYSAGALGVPTDRYLQDVSYLRLKNLSIGYTIPTKKKAFDQIRLYASGENLFYWSKLKKYTKTVDPELTNSPDTYNAGSGVGYSYSKIFTVGIDIIF